MHIRRGRQNGEKVYACARLPGSCEKLQTRRSVTRTNKVQLDRPRDAGTGRLVCLTAPPLAGWTIRTRGRTVVRHATTNACIVHVERCSPGKPLSVWNRGVGPKAPIPIEREAVARLLDHGAVRRNDCSQADTRNTPDRVSTDGDCGLGLSDLTEPGLRVRLVLRRLNSISQNCGARQENCRDGHGHQ